MASVTRSANIARSTASACPAGTAHSRAIPISSDPARRISSFNNQGAVFSRFGFQGIRANEFRKIRSLMRRRRAHRTHLKELNRNSPPRTLPRRFRSRQPGADDFDPLAHAAITTPVETLLATSRIADKSRICHKLPTLSSDLSCCHPERSEGSAFLDIQDKPRIPRRIRSSEWQRNKGPWKNTRWVLAPRCFIIRTAI